MDVIKYVLCAAVAASAGYFAAKIHLEAKYYEQMQRDLDAMEESMDHSYQKRIQEMREEFEVDSRPKGEDEVTFSSTLIPDTVSEALTNYRGVTKTVAPTPESVTEKANIFDNPFVISQEEFFENGQDKQYSITWYDGDKTLAGQSDKVIPDETIEACIGKHHLEMFGVKSEDEDVVYIRNPITGSDYEITRSRGKYSVEVLGESG